MAWRVRSEGLLTDWPYQLYEELGKRKRLVSSKLGWWYIWWKGLWNMGMD